MPTPFDMGAVIGPVLNEGTEAEFCRTLISSVRKFVHSKPLPINVDTEVVERHLLRQLLHIHKGQTTLTGLGVDPARIKADGLSGNPPWKLLNNAQ